MLDIFTSKSYPFDDPRFWISDARFMFSRSVKDIKTYLRLVSEARKNRTLRNFLLFQKNLRYIISKENCRIGFIDLQEEEELHVSNSADLLHLMSQNPQPHDVFIRVGIPEAADFPMPTKLRFANMFHNLAANIYEMYIRGNILTILLPEPNFDLVFGDWDTNGLECDKDFTRRNLDIQLQSRF